MVAIEYLPIVIALIAFFVAMYICMEDLGCKISPKMELTFRM